MKVQAGIFIISLKSIAGLSFTCFTNYSITILTHCGALGCVFPDEGLDVPKS